MLQLRVFGERPAMTGLVRRLAVLEGAGHITLAGVGNGDGRVVVTRTWSPPPRTGRWRR
jgi:hypothetical protein